MKKTLLLLTIIIVSGCIGGRYLQPQESLMSADINGIPHQSQFTEWPTTMDHTAKGNYDFCSDYRIITSDNGHEARLRLKFNDNISISEFKPFTKYTIKAVLRYDLESGNYKDYETSDGWIEFTYIKEHQRKVYRLEGQFEFHIKDPDSGHTLISVTNGKFDLPVQT